MANEATLRDRIDHPINFTVADGVGIEKGTVMALFDGRYAAAASGSRNAIAGILAEEKIASDGVTTRPLFRRGIFDMTASGAITVGDAVVSAAATNNANHVASAYGDAASGAKIIGHALETATDDEVVQIWVDIGAGGAQA